MTEKEIETALQAALVSVGTVATILLVSQHQVRNLRRVGMLEGVNISPGVRPTWRIKSDSVKRLLDQRA